MAMTPFEIYGQFRALVLTTCTASATPGSEDSLVNKICYDPKGCCAGEQEEASVTLSSKPDYAACIVSANSAEAKLACSG
jgi:hypothetical protein